MSLTSLLRNNEDVRERFRQEFLKPRFSIKKDILAPPLSTNRSSLVGTAFDYLLRFYLQRLNPNTVCRRWVAEDAANCLAASPILYKKGQEIIKRAKKNVTEFLKAGQISDELIKSAVLLGGLDPIIRAGRGHENVGLVYKEDIQDLRKLITIFEPRLFKARRLCLVNPTFGAASTMVGGADADLVIDDTIIDVKTTKKLDCLSRDFHQLIGYYVLHQIGAIGEIRPKLRIKKVAIYFSRFAYLHSFEIKEILEPSTFPEFVKWFETRARKEKDIANRALKARMNMIDRKYPIDHIQKWTNKKGESLLLNKSGDYFIIGSPRVISGKPVRDLIKISEAKAMRWLKTKT